MHFGDAMREAEVTVDRFEEQEEGPTQVRRLVERVLGPGSVRVVPPKALPGAAAIAKVRGEWIVFVSSGLPVVRERFALAHELGHFVLGLDSSSPANEAACDAFAAAVIAPGGRFSSCVEREGMAPTLLARRFVMTETCACLRIGEVTGTPIAVVKSPGLARFRGESYPWPAHLSRSRELYRVRLRDEGVRFALAPRRLA